MGIMDAPKWLLGDWDGQDIGLRRFSLAFSDHEQEARFLEARAAKLRHNMYYLALVAFVLGVFAVLRVVATRPYHLGEQAVSVHMFKEKVLIADCSMAVCGMIVIRTPATYNRMGPRSFELFCFLVMFFVMLLLMTFAGGLWTLTALFGKDPEIVWDKTCFCETSTILWAATHISAMHMQPMRWSMLLTYTVAGTSWYVAMSLIWGAYLHEGWLANLLLFTFMAVVTSIGKRTNEITERMLFVELAEEKSLRLHAQLGLLNSICDVVVRTDGQGCIQETSPNLASILVLDSHTAGGLVGTRIQTFMQGDDGDRCTRYLAEAQKHPGCKDIIAPLHVDFRDSLGSKVPVTLRCSCVLNKHGEASIMMGIREMGPREVELVGDLPALSAAVNVGQGSGSASSCSNESWYKIDTSDCIWVEFLAATYQIVEASPAYREITGTDDTENALFTDALLHVSRFDELFQASLQPIKDGLATEEIIEDIEVKMSLFPQQRVGLSRCQGRNARRRTYKVSLTLASYGIHWSPELKMLARVEKVEHMQRQLRRGTGASSDVTSLLRMSL